MGTYRLQLGNEGQGQNVINQQKGSADEANKAEKEEVQTENTYPISEYREDNQE
jgi:hypothetical protein